MFYFKPVDNFDLSLNITQPDPSSNCSFMSVDQTFHTPSFGDEEFEIPSLSFAPSGTIINRCGAQQGIFANQVLNYQRASPLQQHQLQTFQQQQQHHPQHQQLFGVSGQPNHAMSNGHYQNNQGNSSQQQQIFQQAPENIMGPPHSMNIQMQSFDGCNSYSTNSGMQQQQQMRDSPLHLMQQQQALMGLQQQQQQPVFSTISHSQLSNQLGLQIGMGPATQRPPSSGGSPPGSNNNSPGRETSEDSDDSTPLAQLVGGLKRPSPEPVDIVAPKVTKKPKPQKKKKKRDPNEPQKPVSAYALFFRDTQAAIKGQNPNASFGEVSKIVASMWDSLDADTKSVYKKKTETAKKEYLKALAAYRATLVSKAAVDQSDSMYSANAMGSSSPPITSSPVTSSTGHVMMSTMQMKRSPVLTSVVDAMQPVTAAPHPQLNPQQVWHVSPPQMMNNNSPPHMMPPTNMVNMQPQMHSPSQQMHSSPQQQMHSSPQQQMHSPTQQQQQQMHSPAQQQQMMMSRPQQQPPPQQQPQSMSSVPQQQLCHPAASSPTYVQNMSPAAVGGTHSNMGGAEMMSPLQTCLRSGCSNPAVDSPDWDREYCSSECVVSHCRDVFTAWVASRQVNPAYSTVK